MSRRKSYLLFAAVAGAMGVAEAVAVVLAVQVDWRTAGPLTAGLAIFALLLWTVLLAAGVAAWALHLVTAGLDAACSRLDSARMTADVALLSATPTIELLGKALRRQATPLGELRDELLACAVAGRAGAAPSGVRLARAAGLAAGVLRANESSLRLIAALEDWIEAARSRQNEVRARTGEIRELLERLPAPVLARSAPSAPVYGYGVAEEAPPTVEDPWGDLPAALQERLRGSSPRWWDADEAEPDRN